MTKIYNEDSHYDLIVKSLLGESHSFTLSEFQTVAELKEMIELSTGNPSNSQILLMIEELPTSVDEANDNANSNSEDDKVLYEIDSDGKTSLKSGEYHYCQFLPTVKQIYLEDSHTFGYYNLNHGLKSGTHLYLVCRQS